MKIVAPAYYTAFRCIADRCRHNCCIGWDIDIDTDTAAFYETVGGALGDRLRKSIRRTDEGCSFILGDDGRCPFLNADGLCDLIAALGDGALCQICADHPRFRNLFSDREEIGLGLCCEEAARLILTSDDNRLSVLEDDGEPALPDAEETAFFAAREQVFAIARDRSLTNAQREATLLAHVNRAPLAPTALYECLQPLERLDPTWDAVLRRLSSASDSAPPIVLNDAFSRLLVYFLYRHTADSLFDGRFEERVAFAVHSAKVLRLLCGDSGSLEELAELARAYSAEIEYSDENMDTLLDMF